MIYLNRLPIIVCPNIDRMADEADSIRTFSGDSDAKIVHLKMKVRSLPFTPCACEPDDVHIPSVFHQIKTQTLSRCVYCFM